MSKEREIKIETKNKTTYFSLCGAAASCEDKSVSACEITDGKVFPLAKLNTQHTHYDKNHNLMVRMHNGEKKRCKYFY